MIASAARVDRRAIAPATPPRPAAAPSHPGRADRRDVRLLAVDTTHGRLLDRAIGDLPALLVPGDLVVLNDAATLPASLSGRAPSGAPIEIRLAGPPGGSSRAGELGDGAAAWPAVLLGPGDWHTRTEDRAPPERLSVGDVVELGPSGAALRARVAAVSPRSPRLVDLCFDREGAPLYAALYRIGRPVQYAHQDHDLALWTVQTAYAGPPWAAEMPSAGRPLSWELLAGLRRRGVELAWLTHAAGLSATGDPALDALLPLPERYRIPAATAEAAHRARAAGRRVIAVGTTVVRALEGAARDGRWAGGSGTTDLVIEPGARLAAVDGLLSGIHAPSESHYRLLGAFATPALLDAAWRHAQAGGYLEHELGDLCLIAPEAGQADQAA